MISHINHITLIVNNLEESKKFYINELKLESLPSLDFDYPVEFFRINTTQQLHLTEWDDTYSFRGHACFTVTNFNELFWRFKELGCIDTSPWGKVRNLPDGATQMFIRDPSGNLLEISAPPEYEIDLQILSDELFQQDGDLYVSGRDDARGTRGSGGSLYHKK